MEAFVIRPINTKDHEWVARLLKEHWDSTVIITRGREHRADELPGFVAIHDDKYAGLITYSIESDECEIMSINSLVEGMGMGSALIEAVKGVAVEAGCKRIWLITTNDNTAALRFWQKQGFSLVAVYPDAIEHSRRLKPEIGLVGNDGIPIRDEIELEILL